MRDKGERLDHNRVWLKAEGPMPDDPVLHAAALVYSSDTTVLDSIITTHGLSWGFDRIFAVTINHSVWFHRPVRFDEWVLYSTTSPVAAESRGLGTGHFFDRSGQRARYRRAGGHRQVLPLRPSLSLRRCWNSFAHLSTCCGSELLVTQLT